ncbi:MAG: hypothetical protein HY907_13785 [Deltaproteobacteria bacterium]|nr:hypothetical protein [Deltaproteobacteria bacterium]
MGDQDGLRENRWVRRSSPADLLAAAGVAMVALTAACSGGSTMGDADGAGTDDAAADAGDDAAPEEAEPDGTVDDAAPDEPLDVAEAEADVEDDADAEDVPDAGPCVPWGPPDERGPYPVGVRDFAWRDPDRGGRNVATKVWYPALPPDPGADPAVYLWLLRDTAYVDLPIDPGCAPYPLILFSHGNKGINFQSFTFTTYLASHGFVVAAPNHAGNTMYDNPSDEQMAQVSLDRPIDMAFVLARMTDETSNPDSPLFGAVDVSRVGITGHSFGGYTTLVVGGGEVDRDAAVARCDAGVPGDVFCPYVPYWPPGMVGTRLPELAIVGAAVALAPGGYAAFGDDGLARTTAPTMVMGGTLDEYTRNDLRPIFDALPAPKAKIEIADMGHMGFTDICRIAIAPIIPTLGEMCTREGHIAINRGFAITDTFATAFLRLHLLDDAAMADYLTPEYAATVFPESTFEGSP